MLGKNKQRVDVKLSSARKASLTRRQLKKQKNKTKIKLNQTMIHSAIASIPWTDSTIWAYYHQQMLLKLIKQLNNCKIKLKFWRNHQSKQSRLSKWKLPKSSIEFTDSTSKNKQPMKKRRVTDTIKRNKNQEKLNYKELTSLNSTDKKWFTSSHSFIKFVKNKVFFRKP